MIIIHWEDGSKEEIYTKDQKLIRESKDWLANKLKQIPNWESEGSHFFINLDNARMLEIRDVQMD